MREVSTDIGDAEDIDEELRQLVRLGFDRVHTTAQARAAVSRRDDLVLVSHRSDAGPGRRDDCIDGRVSESARVVLDQGKRIGW